MYTGSEDRLEVQVVSRSSNVNFLTHAKFLVRKVCAKKRTIVSIKKVIIFKNCKSYSNS